MMPTDITTAIAIFGSYLIGSLSSAIIICRIMRLPDPRTHGSENPGATNVLRIGGRIPALFTLAGDLLKGVIPVAIAKTLVLPPPAIALVAFAAFVGHLYPIFFGFKGGKGVATYLGCLLALSLPTGLSWIATWCVMAFLFRYSSLAALTACLVAPIIVWYVTDISVYVMLLNVMAVIIYIRHHANIRKLLTGTESKIGKKTK